MRLPWHMGESLDESAQAEVRRRAIFECGKWDPQVGDVSALASGPLLVRASVWRELAGLAERLAGETLAMEVELLGRPELWKGLGLPRAFCRALGRLKMTEPVTADLRVMRFDFHWTTEGWRISEVNSDVPGGFVEAGAISALVARYYPGTRLLGDPVAALVEGFSRRLGGAGEVGLVHATAFTDDRQVMVHLGEALGRAGLGAHLMAPDHVRWVEGRPSLPEAWGGGHLDGLFRFFPAEWLPNLSRRSGWEGLLGGGRVPMCNPGWALLSQSKRLPLVWDKLGCRLEAWRALLPETVDPRSVDWRESEEWVVKPALGRVGDMVGVAGATRVEDWRAIRRWVFWHPGHWVAQRRFEAVPVWWEGRAIYPGLGVYVVGGRAVGVYGRVAERALIDHAAQDVAVLWAEAVREEGGEREVEYESHRVV